MNERFLQFYKKIPTSSELKGWACLLLLVYLLFVEVVSAKTSNDPLVIPAEKILTQTALASMLFDTVNTGQRLVVVGERGHILYSSDNGVTWVQADVPVSVTLTAVCFPTAQQGWAVGHDGVVLHTSDGGSSWVRQLDGNQVNTLIKNHVKYLLEVKKSKGIEQEIEALDFLLSDANTALEEGAARPFMDVWFKNEREGLIIGAFGLILRTKDGGTTWLPILDRMDNPDNFHYYGITRAGESLFIAGEGGILFRSDDEGKTWFRLDSPYEGSFFGIVGDPENNFVVVFGMEGKAYRSDDNGHKWKLVRINNPTSLSGGAVLSNGCLVISGLNGVLFYSKDGGKLFYPLRVKFPGCMAISTADADHIILAGLGGLIRTAVIESK